MIGGRVMKDLKSKKWDNVVSVKYCKDCVYYKKRNKIQGRCDKLFMSVFSRYMGGNLAVPEDHKCDSWRLRVSNNMLKLYEIVLDEQEIEIVPILQRTRSGFWQRGQGAWSWAVNTTNSMNLGSQHSLACVVKQTRENRKYLVEGRDIEIIIGNAE